MGEGGALVILESEEHAKARGASIFGRLLGAGITSDAFNIVAPEPEGKGAARAMTIALQRAGLTQQDIDHVNAHATATPVGDLAEAKAIRHAVGDHPVVYAPKSALGHSIGATGATEAILTIQTLREGIIPPTLNLEHQDPEIELDVTALQSRTGNFRYAINNSFGFGGHNVALVFARD
jgi:beta-ketoacyl ACP synthase